MEENAIGASYPHVNLDACISCRRCEKACPILHPVEYHGTSKCYAAWNQDAKQRHSSASGGIAIAVYTAALEQGAAAVGASLNKDWSVTHKIATTEQELQPFKNSKYVFSSAYAAFPQIKKLLKKKKNVVMIGLPCQIAAMRKLFGSHEHLLLIDIVCHGATPVSYLRQHIRQLEQIHGKEAAALSFRAPEKGTANYYFTLYDEKGDIFYSRRSADGDTYNIGFHRMISYRENCYRCRFARPERVSDITLGDYHGLGKLSPCDYAEEEVSTIMVHTPQGYEMIQQLIASGIIHADERPVEEPVMGDAQLRRPSPKSAARADFERYIAASNGQFEYSIRRVLHNIKRRQKLEIVRSYPSRVINKLMRIAGLRKNTSAL